MVGGANAALRAGGSAQLARTPTRDTAASLATLALIVAACLPLMRVFVGTGFLRPVLGAAVLSLGASWGSRRLGAGPVTALGISTLAWVVFVGVAFLPGTLAFGVVPTTATSQQALALWRYGVELVRLRAAPAFAEPGLLLLTITGIWAVVHLIDGLANRVFAPVRAIAMALVLWTVPLAIAPPLSVSRGLAALFAAAALVLLVTATSTDLGRWGQVVATGFSLRRAGAAAVPVAVVAIVAGLLGANALPGFGAPAWYQLRGRGGTTLTTNPIVNLRTTLVATDTGPVLRVRTPRPVYLRTTALDVYSEDEEWTNEGISGRRFFGALPLDRPLDDAPIQVDVEVVDLPGAVLVPVPHQPAVVSSGTSSFRFDTDTDTVATVDGETLEASDRYSVLAAVPRPDPGQLNSGSLEQFPPRLVELPGEVPEAVAALARDIVTRAQAVTPYEQALAIQSELRTWTYSLNPPEGHSGQAMESFITNRVGYCEQYAGTMAVMLRSLGIPARVAVGFTPGRLINPEIGEYEITNANAHAWPEVYFGSQGWLALEPTPRGDGNVLVPNGQQPAPARTQQQVDALRGDGTRSDQAERDRLRDERREPTPLPAPEAQSPAAGAAARWDWLRWGAGLVGVLGVLATGAVRLRRRVAASGDPGARVLWARRRAGALGRALRVRPTPAETDAEYVERLVGDHPAGRALVSATERARYAPQLAEVDARLAERAAAELEEHLLRDLSPAGRVIARARSSAELALAGARRDDRS